MKRIHIHVGVDSLERAIPFYSALFAAEPVKTREDYAKWLLEDPPLNFAISTRSGRTGLDHLGVQVDDEAELANLRQRIGGADLPVLHEGETVCCYARSDKSWIRDPAGIAWEAYRTMADAELYGDTIDADTLAGRGSATVAPVPPTPATTGGTCCGGR